MLYTMWTRRCVIGGPCDLYRGEWPQPRARHPDLGRARQDESRRDEVGHGYSGGDDGGCQRDHDVRGMHLRQSLVLQVFPQRRAEWPQSTLRRTIGRVMVPVSFATESSMDALIFLTTPMQKR